MQTTEAYQAVHHKWLTNIYPKILKISVPLIVFPKQKLSRDNGNPVKISIRGLGSSHLLQPFDQSVFRGVSD